MVTATNEWHLSSFELVMFCAILPYFDADLRKVRKVRKLELPTGTDLQALASAHIVVMELVVLFVTAVLLVPGLAAEAAFRHRLVAPAEVPIRPDVEYLQKARPDAQHSVVFAIRQRNMDNIFSILHDVSDPDSPRYGHHLSNAQVVEMTKNEIGHDTVKQFLLDHGIEIQREQRNKHYLTATARVSQWEPFFNAHFHEYRVDHDDRSKKVVMRSDSLSLPEEVAEHVEHVFHTVDFPIPTYSRLAKHKHKKRQLKGKGMAVQAADSVDPALLRSYYDIAVTGTRSSTQALYGALDQQLSLSDLTDFQNEFSLAVQGIDWDVGGHVLTGPCKDNVDDCLEANLDVQYAMATAQNVSTIYYYWTGNDIWLDWIQEVADMSEPPEVFSISYASYESDVNAISGYFNSFENEAAKLGVQGVTLIAASGDDGVAGWRVRGMSSRCGYQPMFPASSNYVTALGGTQGPEKGASEVACQSSASKDVLITSGGGISRSRALQSWQASHVSGYFTTVAGTSKDPVSGYDTSGRGLPDVSLLAHNYDVMVNGSLLQLDGTSASSPVFAGMVSLINSKRKQQGFSTLGWFNPALYKHSAMYVRDITSGHNRCSALFVSGGSYASTCCSQGYYAATGWDPVTGLGSIDFDSMYSYFALNTTTAGESNDFVPTANNDDSGTASNNTVVIIAVVVAVIGGFALIAGVVMAVQAMCMNCNRSTAGGGRYNPTPTVAVMVPPPRAPHTVAVAVYSTGEHV